MKAEETYRLTDADQAFLITLFEDSKDIIKIRARQKLGNDLDTEDILQNTFEIACKRIKKIRESNNPVGWMILTAHNEIKHALRRRSKIIYIEDMQSIPDPTEHINLGLDELLPQDMPREDADLLKQVYERREKIQDAAKDMDVGYDALKWRLKRIRDKLKPDIEKLIGKKAKYKNK